ncbi:fluoride efflux transporter CrcB [Caulobacter mirabilis]|uniref:Fluoride-specific ion channel FluC n=1 Tax=Caulobacter mirabilis TaxID=69666 RepID=A0A2D2AX56_9CAUL|nr:fluoride efflux transporter CrcB [Caulobacter mirabilis]ATQ42594.1 fluoride efflux transporter CrcB [Caulobacter mirabilis]
MDKLLLVALGGGAGAVARYLVGVQSMRLFGPGWPWGTLIVNLLGGLAMGVLVAVLALRGGADQERWRVLLGVGVLGGFTTFSAFSLETALMIERKQWTSALSYSALSVVLSVGALFAGMFLIRKVLAA